MISTSNVLARYKNQEFFFWKVIIFAPSCSLLWSQRCLQLLGFPIWQRGQWSFHYRKPHFFHQNHSIFLWLWQLGSCWMWPILFWSYHQSNGLIQLCWRETFGQPETNCLHQKGGWKLQDLLSCSCCWYWLDQRYQYSWHCCQGTQLTLEEIASSEDIQYQSNAFDQMLSIICKRFWSNSNAFDQTL